MQQFATFMTNVNVAVSNMHSLPIQLFPLHSPTGHEDVKASIKNTVRIQIIFQIIFRVLRTLQFCENLAMLTHREWDEYKKLSCRAKAGRSLLFFIFLVQQQCWCVAEARYRKFNTKNHMSSWCKHDTHWPSANALSCFSSEFMHCWMKPGTENDMSTTERKDFAFDSYSFSRL